MTIGIYSLYWEEPDLIYIGQSQNIEQRFIIHLRSMNNKSHFNYKVQDTYNKYGEPQTSILEVCTQSELNNLEIYYIAEFTGILNITEGGNSPQGVSARNSKYSKIQILKVFSLLYKGLHTVKSIADKLKVPTHTINDIKEGRSHIWLQVCFPEKYLLMRNLADNYCSIKDISITKDVLDPLILKHSWTVLGSMFGYSDNGIKKRAKALGCTIPVRNKR